MYSIAFASAITTAILFMIVAFITYKYATILPTPDRFWELISVGFLVISFGNFMKAGKELGMNENYPVITLIAGSILLLSGFYNLYTTHKV